MFYTKIFPASQGKLRKTQRLFFKYQLRGSIEMCTAVVQVPLEE